MRYEFIEKVREIGDYLGEEITLVEDTDSTVVLKTTTRHYIPRGKFYQLNLKNGLVRIIGWISGQDEDVIREIFLENFLNISTDELERYEIERQKPTTPY